MKYDKKNEGLPIPVVAVTPQGEVQHFESKTAAAREYGISLQYVHRCCNKNPLRPYQCNDIRQRPVRFCLESDHRHRTLAEVNRQEYERFEKQNEYAH